MNIVHVITSLDVGGAELMLLRLCRSLNASGNRNSVVCLFSNPETKNKFLQEKIEVIDLHAGKSVEGLFKLAFGFFALKEKIGFYPDVIQGWLPHGNILALLLAKVFYPRAALVWNIRQSLHTWGTNSVMTKGLIRLGASLSSLPDLILFNSQRGFEQHAAIGYSRLRAKVIANGFDLAAFAGAENRTIRNEALTVVHLGRKDPAKDHATFFRAAILVLKNFPDVTFKCVGRGVSFDDEELGAIVPEVLRGRFVFMGQRSDVPEILLSSDVYCSSSNAEAFSNAIGEAMAAGLPCVVTDVGDSKTIVGDVGVVVPPRDPPALAKALEKVLAMSVDERRTLGARARERVREHYSLERITRQYLEVYRGLR